MGKKTILQLISSSAFLGAERVLCELASNLDLHRFRVHVGLMGCPESLEQAFNELFHDHDVKLINFRCHGKLSASGLREIGQYLCAHSIDLVHSHGYKSDAYALAATRLWRRGACLVATNHTWKQRTFAEYLYKSLDKKVLKAFGSIVAVSDEVRLEMVQSGILADRITVIRNGVSTTGYDDAHRATVRKDLGLSEDDFVIGCVASLTVEKAHSELVDAFAAVRTKVPHAKLLLVGAGPQMEALQRQVADLDLRSAVIFTGHRNDIKKLYQALDVFALVSHAEGLPMALLEAMAASLPVVVSTVGAMPQVIDTPLKGVLVSPGDIEAIANALFTLSSKPELRSTMGKHARNELVENYSNARMANEYQSLYQSAMERP